MVNRLMRMNFGGEAEEVDQVSSVPDTVEPEMGEPHPLPQEPMFVLTEKKLRTWSEISLGINPKEEALLILNDRDDPKKFYLPALAFIRTEANIFPFGKKSKREQKILANTFMGGKAAFDMGEYEGAIMILEGCLKYLDEEAKNSALQMIIYSQVYLEEFDKLANGALKKFVDVLVLKPNNPYPLHIFVLGSAIASLVNNETLARQLYSSYVLREPDPKIEEEEFSFSPNRACDTVAVSHGLDRQKKAILRDILQKIFVENLPSFHNICRKLSHLSSDNDAVYLYKMVVDGK